MPRLLTQAEQTKIAMLHRADEEGRKQAHIDMVMQLAKTAARTMAWQQMMHMSSGIEKDAFLGQVGKAIARPVAQVGKNVVGRIGSLFGRGAAQGAEAAGTAVTKAVAPAVSKAVKPAVDKGVLLSNLRSGGLARPSGVAPSPFNPIVKDVGRAAAPASSAADAGRQALRSNVQNRGLVRPSSNVAASPYNQGLSNVTQVTKPPLAAQPTQVMPQPSLAPPTQVTGAPLAAQPTQIMTQPGLGPAPTRVTGPPLAAQPTQVMPQQGLGSAPTQASATGPISVQKTPLNEVSTSDIIRGQREGVDRYFVGPHSPYHRAVLQSPPTQAASGLAYEPTQVAHLQAPPTQVTGAPAMPAPAMNINQQRLVSAVKAKPGLASPYAAERSFPAGTPTAPAGASPVGLQPPAAQASKIAPGEFEFARSMGPSRVHEAAGAAPAVNPAFYSEAQRADAISGARKALASGKVPSSAVKQQWRDKGIYDDIMRGEGKVRAAGPEVTYKGGTAEEAVERAFAQAKPAGPSKGGVGPIKVHGSESLKKRPSLESPRAGREKPITPTQGPVASGEINSAGTLSRPSEAGANKSGLFKNMVDESAVAEGARLRGQVEAARMGGGAAAKAGPAVASPASVGARPITPTQGAVASGEIGSAGTLAPAPVAATPQAAGAASAAGSRGAAGEINAPAGAQTAPVVNQPSVMVDQSLMIPQAAGAKPTAAVPSTGGPSLSKPQAAGATPTAKKTEAATGVQKPREGSLTRQQQAAVREAEVARGGKELNALNKKKLEDMTEKEVLRRQELLADKDVAAAASGGAKKDYSNALKWGLIGGVGLPALGLAYGATQAAPAVAGALSSNAQQPLSYGVGPNPGLTPNYM